MGVVKILGIVLLVAGVLALVYGGFTYTQETHSMDVGPLELSVEEKETVNVPLWGGIASIVLGAVLLFLPSSRR